MLWKTAAISVAGSKLNDSLGVDAFLETYGKEILDSASDQFLDLLGFGRRTSLTTKMVSVLSRKSPSPTESKLYLSLENINRILMRVDLQKNGAVSRVYTRSVWKSTGKYFSPRSINRLTKEMSSMEISHCLIRSGSSCFDSANLIQVPSPKYSWLSENSVRFSLMKPIVPRSTSYKLAFPTCKRFGFSGSSTKTSF